MRVVYNWLKEFVDVPATVQELAARLALHGTNVASVEPQPLGGVIDAEVTSNRPDCLGVMESRARSAPSTNWISSGVTPKVTESSAAKTSDAVSIKIEAPELCGRFTARVIRNVKIQPSPCGCANGLAAAGVGVHQQRCGCDQLRDDGTGSRAARVRLRSGAQSCHRGAACQAAREN